MLWVMCITFVALAFGHEHPMPPNPVPGPHVEGPVKLPDDYEKWRMHDTQQRDHGCAEFPDEVEQPHHCVMIYLKNKFSEANIAPAAFFTDFEYHGTKNAWKPAVTWVEHVTAKYVRACAAAPGGTKKVLGEGKLRWLALYNETASNTEQFGTFKPVDGKLIGGKFCYPVVFVTPFPTPPIMKFTFKVNGKMNAKDAMTVWLKGVTQTSAIVCLEEFYAWSNYHTNFEMYWYGLSSDHNEDEYQTRGKVSFNAVDTYPADHNKINEYFCKNVTLPTSYHPCPTILVQPEEPSMSVCETPLVAWVSYYQDNLMVVCYADKRGIRNQRVSNIDVHYIIYGHQAPCASKVCPVDQKCFHPTWNTAQCGCVQSCADGGEKACGTNMMTYKNKCELERVACMGGNKFSYAHKGECEKFTLDHGRESLTVQPGCEGLYCKVISTRNNIWYENADINVQISVNWNSALNNQVPQDHDATSSWVEDLTPTSFKACVMEAGRRTFQTPPMINWFAYQGVVENVMTRKIEVGDWTSGTHCVPLHERKPIESAMKYHPMACPKIQLKDIGKVEEDQWQYDAHLMSQIYGQSQHEWFKRMLMGYGVHRMKLTSGMHMDGATVMMTVEQSNDDTVVNAKDAVNAWMEFDNATHEAYICLRELGTWDGVHKDINVHWTLFNDSFIRSLGFSHKLKFKPHFMESSMYNQNNANCQTKRYLPDDMDLINSATILVSLSHLIPIKSELDSMKEYQLHQMAIMKGAPIGDFDFMKKDVQESWTMPHMWRANLTGWRPHMRINKNADYSVWLEGMNNTHMRVCQKSLYSGFHYEGVMVNVFVLPDRCPSGYRLFKDNMCGVFRSQVVNHNTSGLSCQSFGERLAVADDCRENVWLSYLAGQQSINIARSDFVNEGNWLRDYGNTNPYTYSRWGPGQPSNSLSTLDCAVQNGRTGDFYEFDGSCTALNPFVCIRPAPFLSCNFRKPGYCNDCGKCNKIQPYAYTCQCIPPYGGTRCEVKIPH